MRLFLLHSFIFLLFLSATEVSLALPWRNQFQFAGYYVAIEKGYYSDLGLELKIDEYKLHRNNTDEVLKGTFDFGVGHSSLVLDSINKPDSLLLMAAIHQSSPLILLSKKRKDLTKLSDIKNKIIMMSNDDTYKASINAMLLSQGLTTNSYKTIETSFDPVQIINGEADIMLAFTSNEPFVLKEKGVKYTTFSPKDYGYDFYSDILFTSQKFFNKNPYEVKAFYEASMKGWLYAYAHPEETVDIILNKYNTQNRSKKSLLYEAETLKKLAFKDGVAFGNINPLRLREIANTYRLLGLTNKKNPDFNSIIYNSSEKIHIKLTKEQKEFLISKDTFKLCVVHDDFPVQGLSKGTFVGLSAEVFSILNEKMKKNIVTELTHDMKDSLASLKEKKCDIIPAFYGLALEQNSGIVQTKAFIDIPLNVITNKKLFIHDVKSLKNKKVALNFRPNQKDLFKNIEYVASVQEGLDKLSKEEVVAVVVDSLSLKKATKSISMDQFNILIIDETMPISLAVLNDNILLQEILNLHVESLNQNDVYTILNKWLSFKYVDNFDYTLVWTLISVIVFILLISYIIYIRLKKVVQEKNTTLKQQFEIFDKNICASFTDINGVITYVSHAFCEITGYSKEELIGKTHRVLKNLKREEDIFTDMWMNLSSGHIWKGEILNLSKDGQDIWFDTIITPVFNKKNKIISYEAIQHDITNTKLVAEFNEKLEYEISMQTYQLREQKQYLDTLFEINPNIVYVTDGFTTDRVNRAFLNFLQIGSLEEFLKDNNCLCDMFLETEGYFKPEKDVKTGYQYEEALKLSHKVIININDTNHVFNISIEKFFVDVEKHYLIVLEDITELDHQATFDPLTDIFNRQQIDISLESLINKFNRYEQVFCLLLIDIDYFKNINDTFGHQVGDEVLVEITKLISSRLREFDILGRWGGEEFMVFTPFTNLDGAMTLAESIRQSVEESDFKIEKTITISIGVAEYNVNMDKNLIVQQADKALYIAKDEGRNKVVTI